MKKRFSALFLALAMCLGLAVPAFAVDVKDASQEDILGAFTIQRNGSVNELEGRYRASEPIAVDDIGDGTPGDIYYHVFGQGDSWTITNAGSKAISANGNTDYTIRISTWQYGEEPEGGFVWVGGTSEVTADGEIVHAPEGVKLARLKAGESVTISADAFEEGPYDGTGIVHGMAVCIDFRSEADPDAGVLEYDIFFRGDDAKKAAIDKEHSGETGKPEPTDPVIPAFTDVDEGAYYEDAVKWALAHEPAVTNGTTDTTFEPDTTCTEVQILTFLYRAAGEPETEGKLPVDIEGKNLDYAENALRWANDLGMVDPGTFDPGKSCTRAQAVYFIWMAFGQKEADKSEFKDVAEDAAYAAAVDWAVANGVTNGTDLEAGEFSPEDTCTRGQIVTFLHRAYVEEARLSVET